MGKSIAIQFASGVHGSIGKAYFHFQIDKMHCCISSDLKDPLPSCHMLHTNGGEHSILLSKGKSTYSHFSFYNMTT